MPYCADTSFLIDLQNQEEKAIVKMEQLTSKNEVISTTAVNVAELYFGAYRASNEAAALSDADTLLETFSILNLDHKAARKYGELGKELKSNMIELRDLFVASIAITNGQTLLTRNIKHFERVPGLTWETW
jgi:tRNA(fMet)-specific endonuclease VapC